MPISSPKKTVARDTKNMCDSLEIHGFSKRENGSREKCSRPIGFKYRRLEHWFKPKSRPEHVLHRELRVVLDRCEIPRRNKVLLKERKGSLSGSGMSSIIEPSSFALEKIESDTSASNSRGTTENVIDSGTIAQPKDEPLAILDEPMREKFEEFETFHGKNEDRCPVLSSAISLLPFDSQVAASQSQMEMSDHSVKDVCKGREELGPTSMRRADNELIVDFEATLEGPNILKNEESDEKCDVLYSTEMGLPTGSGNQHHKDRLHSTCTTSCTTYFVKLEQGLERYTTEQASFETRLGEIQNEKSINLTVQPITRNAFLTQEVFTCDTCGMKFLQKNLMPKHMLLHLDTEPFVSCDDRGKDVREESDLARNLLKHKDVSSSLGEVRIDTITKPQSGDKVTAFDIRVNNNLGQKADGSQKFPKLFSCDTCRKNFKSKVTLREHIWKAHDGSKSCTSDKSLIKRNLKSHLLVDRRSKSFSCKICDGTFKSKKCLKQHTARVHRSDPWTCEVCGKFFKLQYSLTAHLRMVHLIGSYVLCEICGKACASKSALKNHSMSHRLEKPYSCDTCGKKFNSKSNLRCHLRIHEPREAFPCEICGKILKSDSSLKIHAGLHMGQRQFSCEVCGDRFAYKGRLWRHMKMHTGKEPYPCKICGKKWLSRDEFEDHMKSHTGEKPFACEICGKRFGRKGTRNLHMKSHVPQMECEVCNRRFRTEIFVKHKTTCKSENRRTCDICNKTYSSRMNLWKHKLTHKSEKRFKCDPCGASFHRKKELQWHMAKHSGAWRFSCEICGHNSNQRGRFETHVKMHDSKQPYFCDICQKYFGIQRRLQSHIQMHHDGNSHSTDEVRENKRGRQVKGNDTTPPQLAQNMGIGAAIEALDKFATE